MYTDIKMLIADENSRSKLLYTVLIFLCFLCCGADIIYQYSFGILQQQGVTTLNSTYISVLVLLVAALASFLGLYTLPKLGKRRSFIISATGMMVCMATFCLVGEIHSDVAWVKTFKLYMTAGSMMGLLLSAEVGVLPVVFTLSATWFEPNVRLTVNAFAVLCGLLLIGLELLLFPQMLIWFGRRVFIFSAFMTVVQLVLGYYKLNYTDEDEEPLAVGKEDKLPKPLQNKSSCLCI